MRNHRSCSTLLHSIAWFLIFSGGCILYGETPEEAINLALENSRYLASVRSGISAAQYEKESTEKSFLPLLSAGSSYQYNSAASEITLPAPINNTISLVQPHSVDLNTSVQWAVFTGFAREANRQIRDIALKIEKNKLQSAEIQTALETLVLYRQVQNASLQVHSLESGRDRISLQIKQLEDLLEQGMASYSDLLSLRLNLLEYDEQINSSVTDLEKARAGLKEKTGKEIQVLDPPDELPSPLIPDLVPGKIPEILSYELQGNMAGARARLRRSSLYPQLSVHSAVHYGIPGADPTANDWMFYTTAGVNLSWSTDWGASQAGAAAEESRREALNLARAEVVNQTILRFERDVSDLNGMIKNLAVLRQAAQLTREKADIIENQYEQGMAAVIDFTDAALAQTQADLRYKTQMLLILLKRDQLEAQSGEAIEKWSVSQ